MKPLDITNFISNIKTLSPAIEVCSDNIELPTDGCLCRMCLNGLYIALGSGIGLAAQGIRQ